MPELAIIIVSYNTADILRECLQAVYRHSRALTTEVIVVDNHSHDDSCRMVREEFPDAHLIALERNAGFGVGNNIGVEAAIAPHLLLLNSDAIMLSDVGAALVAYLQQHADVACVGPRVLLRDGKPQHGVFGEQPSLWRIAMQSSGLNRLFPASRLLRGIEVDRCGDAELDAGWISGVCMAMRRDDYREVGGFDPDLFMYCEDIDLCARLRRKMRRIVHLDSPDVLHYLGASSKSTAARLRGVVGQERNLLRLVRSRSGPAAAFAAKLLLLAGQVPRLAAGMALSPRLGLRDNLVLRSALIRVQDLLGLLRDLPQG